MVEEKAEIINKNMMLWVHCEPFLVQSLERILNCQVTHGLPKANGEYAPNEIILIDADFVDDEKVDGLSLMKQLRRKSRIPILLMSFKRRDILLRGEVAELSKYGKMDGFLQKPIQVNALRSTLDELLTPLDEIGAQLLGELRDKLWEQWYEALSRDFRHGLDNCWAAASLLAGAAFEDVDPYQAGELALELLDIKGQLGTSLEEKVTELFDELKIRQKDKVTRIDQTLTSLPWKKLLLVDDECQSLKWEKVLQFILEPHGWMVESDDGSNPNRVLEKAPEFDVVLLDINLNGKEHDTESVPFCGGLKILSELKKRHLGFPIVMFTVESDIPLSEFCKGEGAMDYFVKKKSVRHEGGFSVSFEYYHDFISTLERAYALSLPFHYLEQLGGKLEAQTVVYLKEAMRWLGDARISLYFSSVFHETVLLLYGQWIGRRQIGEILAQIVHPPPYKQYAYLLWQVRNIIMHSEGITFRPTNTEAELVLIMASAFAQQLNNLAMTERLKEALNRKRRQVTLKFERNLREFLTQDVKRIDMDVFENWNDADRQEHWKALWDVPQALT